MKFMFLYSLVCVLIATTIAATFRGYFPYKDNSNMCLFNNTLIAGGEKVDLNTTCGRISCHGFHGYAEIHTCGVQGVSARHKLGATVEPKAPYPDCCEREEV